MENAHIVPLGQHLWLLPMTDALFDTAAIAAASGLDGFRKIPAGFGRVLAACSANGPVANAEAEDFGGVGTQCAQVWGSTTVVLGPLCLAEGKLPVDGSPISQVLRQLGADHIDCRGVVVPVSG